MILKRSLHRASIHILFLMLIALIFSLSGCAGFEEWKYLPATKADEKTFHVVKDGWHTAIVLSRQDLGYEFSFLDDYLRESPYYEFGWGEADFYQTEKITISLVLKALFWKNPTVMHVVAVPTIPGEYFKQEVVELNLSQTGLDHLRKALRASFKFDENNRPHSLKKGLYGESKFFKAEGYFFIANTCNSWTAAMLESAGVPMDSIPTLRAESVISQAKDAKQRYVCCVH